jgi:ABC-type uncharacterized transport system auxiliary subunit
MMRMLARLLFLLALSTLGCALTSKSDPTLLRYYSLDSPLHGDRLPGSSRAGALPARLRVGRIGAALYIRDRMAFRESGVEIGYYDDFRWTERPESYVRRDLSRALFENEGVEEIVGGPGLTLDVDLDSFEEVREKRAAVVQLSWQLRDDTQVLSRRTVTVERPLSNDTKDGSAHLALAVALSAALRDAIAEVVRAVVPELSTPKGAPMTDAPVVSAGPPTAVPSVGGRARVVLAH